jgi:hypothetical protein
MHPGKLAELRESELEFFAVDCGLVAESFDFAETLGQLTKSVAHFLSIVHSALK